jgi:type VII secretion integral membrane protein EccD
MPDTAVMPIVRVGVLARADDGGRMTELTLPAELPLREILPAVQRIVLPVDEEVDPPGLLSLAPIGGAPFSLDTTLDTVGVVDGDLLALQPLPAGPPAPRIVEDIADAAVIFSAAREDPWGATHIRRGAVGAVIGLVLVITGLGVAHRYATGTALGQFVISAVAAATVLAALVSRIRSPRLAAILALTGLAPVCAAFLLAVPGEFSPAQVMLAAAGVTAWSVIGVTIAQRAIAVFTAAAVVGLGVLLAAAVDTLWELPIATVGCGLVLLALLVTVQAAPLAALSARYPLPVIPAPGDPTPSVQPLNVLEDLPRRVRMSDAHQSGFIAGSVLLSITGSLALAGPAGASPWAWYVVGAAAAGATLRARVWDSTPCKAWLLAYPYLLAVALLVTFAASKRYDAAWWALAALAVLVAMWLVVALNPTIGEPDSYSLPMRRLVGFAASAVDASLIPVMAYLAGLFALVLDR